MANFDSAFNKVIKYEGGYVNDPDDAGGETYMGISRKAHPKSEMWNIIDEIKPKYTTKSSLNGALKCNIKLTMIIKEIYRKYYWNPFNLDNCISNRVAYQIFDTAVNMGVARAKSIIKSLEAKGVIYGKK